MGYYYEPDYYLKEMAKAMSQLESLGGSIKERLKALEDRIQALENKVK